jgi:hypothetical protein
VWEVPIGDADSRWASGWSISGFFKAQSGSPFTVFASEPEIANVSQLTNLARGSGGIYRPGFGRPNLTCSAHEVVSNASTTNLNVINAGCFTSPLGGFGNLGRNTFRGPMQKRLDLSFVKNTKLNDRMSVEIGFDLFNVFNTINFANPNSDLQDSVDFGVITNTVGGPRVGQLRAKFRF